MGILFTVLASVSQAFYRHIDTSWCQGHPVHKVNFVSRASDRCIDAHRPGPATQLFTSHFFIPCPCYSDFCRHHSCTLSLLLAYVSQESATHPICYHAVLNHHPSIFSSLSLFLFPQTFFLFFDCSLPVVLNGL